MRQTVAAIVLVGTVLAGPAACVTVNIYFPAPEVRAAAEEIVNETWGGAGGGPDSAPAERAPVSPPAPEAVSPGAWLRLFAPSAAWAAEGQMNVDVSTAPIRALKAAMRDRAGQLKPYLAAGSVGIGRDGMLVVRDLQGVPLGDQAKIRRLVGAENRDREALYAEIAEANGYGRERIGDIQRIFADTWIEKAEKGWPIQSPSGEWTKK
jgi:uncharacterized protein YdbL (DUF1318 family)